MNTEIHGQAWAFRELMKMAQANIDDDGEIKPAKRLYAEADARVRLQPDTGSSLTSGLPPEKR